MNFKCLRTLNDSKLSGWVIIKLDKIMRRKRLDRRDNIDWLIYLKD